VALGERMLVVEGWLVGLVVVVTASSSTAASAALVPMEEADPGCPSVDKAGCTGWGCQECDLVVQVMCWRW